VAASVRSALESHHRGDFRMAKKSKAKKKTKAKTRRQGKIYRVQFDEDGNPYIRIPKADIPARTWRRFVRFLPPDGTRRKVETVTDPISGTITLCPPNK
jgi:hypothetical protein